MTQLDDGLQKLGEALSQKGRHFAPEEVSTLIQKVLEMLEAQDPPAHTALVGELKDLIVCIQQARTDVSSIKAEEIQSIHIPVATDELDAVVGATAEATGQIMDACEAIEGMDMPEDLKNQVVDHVTKIYEACSFQDITGQRITKVVNTIKQIETKVTKLLTDMGVEVSGDLPDKQNEGDDALLNGPALEGQGLGQDDIDALLASFDEG